MNNVSLPDSTIATAGVGLVALVSLALVARANLPLSAAYPVKAVLFFAGAMTVAIAYVRAHHPFSHFGYANQITTVRVVLLALVVSLVRESTRPELAVSAAAGSLLVALLDGVDGWLARRTRMSSAFGARFDLETDALLILVLSALVWQYDKAGSWVLLSGLLRYLFVAAGWLLLWMRHPLPPNRRGRVICVVQIVTLSLAILPPIAVSISTILAAGGLLLLTYSFLADALWLWRRAG